MKVFNACIKVIKKRSLTLVIYFSVFLVLSVAISKMYTESNITDFTQVKPKFTIINRDSDNLFVEGLKKYLENHGENTPLEDDKSVLQDATFYHGTDYILIIPEGYSSSNGSIQFETVTTPDSAKGYYMDSLVNQYMNAINKYLSAFPDMPADEITASVSEDLSVQTDVIMNDYSSGSHVGANFMASYQMFAYINLVLTALSISTIMMVFRRPDLHMRNLCSPLKPRSINMQMSLCAFVISISAWFLLHLTTFIMNGKEIIGLDINIILLTLANTFIYTIIGLSIGFLGGMIVKTPNSQNAFSNFTSLSLCFLGGVFVPYSLLGEGMQNVAKFTPTYWYINAHENICSLMDYSAESLKPIFQSFGIQIIYAIAIFSVALVIRQSKQQSEKGFGTIYNEMEA